MNYPNGNLTLALRFARGGGHAVGADLKRWRRARHRQRCGCCSCVIAAGEILWDAELEGEPIVVCRTCAGRP